MRQEPEIASTLFACAKPPAADQAVADAKIISINKIWDAAPHNAFTDLIRFNNRWYLTFREGSGHVSDDGTVRVLMSEDGDAWKSIARIELPDQDLRECKFAITPGEELTLTGAACNRGRPGMPRHCSYTWMTSDGEHWSEPTQVVEPNVWLWRNTWHNDVAYGFGYSTVEPFFERLYTSWDGKYWDTLVKHLLTDSFPTEAGTLFLEDERLLALVRQDHAPFGAMLGISKPPYTDWRWQDIQQRAESATLIQLPDGRIVAVARLLDPMRASLCWINADARTLIEFLKLPSGGDCGYAGAVLHDGLLWVSYYSSHEDKKASIYIAQIRIDDGNTQ